MLNLALSLAIGLTIGLALGLPRLLRPGEATMPALVVAIIAFVVLARRSGVALQQVVARASVVLRQSPPRFDAAVRELSRGYRLAPWQFGVRSQIDAQVGSIYFLQREFGRALAPLQRSLMLAHWVPGAMLGVIYFRKKDFAATRRVFEVVLRKGRKSPLAWCLWAYLLCQMNARAEAQRVLAEGTGKLPGDVRLREALLALQNGRKIKMRAFGEQWYQFHLERPPQQVMQAPAAGRARPTQRRGRW